MPDSTGQRFSAPTVVYRASGREPVVARTAGPLIVVLGLLLIGVGLVHGGFGAVLGGLIFVAIGLWPISVLRQRVVLDDTTLLVQGRFTGMRVDLATVDAVHEDRTRTVWVSATGQRPFAICFVTGGSEPPFVREVRRRALACGAPLDPDAERIANPPRGTRRLFTF